jgi:peroxiredoxin
MGTASWWLLLMMLVLPGCGREEEAVPLPPVGVEEGSLAPPLEGRLAGGEPFSLAPGEETTLLVFYRGAYCGLCRERLRRLQEHLPTYREMDTRVIAVTPDDTAEIRSTAARLGLEFPIVSVDTAVLARWNVLDPEDRSPRPVASLLDPRGVVRFRHVGRNAADWAGDVAILTVLQRARGENPL